jgi:hypothetical protein
MGGEMQDIGTAADGAAQAVFRRLGADQQPAW